MIVCLKCGKENPDDANFCMECGERLEEKNIDEKPWEIGVGGI